MALNASFPHPQRLTSRSKANAPARAFHVGSMYYAGRAMTSEGRSMLLMGGHGRTNNMGVDVTRNDIFEYTFRNQRWLSVLVDDAQLPRPDARYAHAGGVVDGTDVIEFAGASCLETETGLLCQPAFNDAWAFDMTGRRTIRGSVKGSVVDSDGRAVRVARLVAFSVVRCPSRRAPNTRAGSPLAERARAPAFPLQARLSNSLRGVATALSFSLQGNQAAFVKEDTHDGTFIDLEAGEVVVVGYNNGMPVASGVQDIISTDTVGLAQIHPDTTEESLWRADDKDCDTVKAQGPIPHPQPAAFCLESVRVRWMHPSR
jgi:hypothetical protein